MKHDLRFGHKVVKAWLKAGNGGRSLPIYISNTIHPERQARALRCANLHGLMIPATYGAARGQLACGC